MEFTSMGRDRRIAFFSGLLILLGIVVGVLSIVPAVEGPNYLSEVAQHEDQVLRGGVFQFLLVPIYLGFALLLYPILKRYNESLAIGFVGFRIIAQIFQLIGVILLPLFVVLSKTYVDAGTTDLASLELIGDLLRMGRDLVNHVGVMASTGLGNLLLYYIFYKTRLVPRWLSVFGFVGNGLGILASVLIFFSMISVISEEFILLALPLVAQEVVLALWLLTKGFQTNEPDLATPTV